MGIQKESLKHLDDHDYETIMIIEDKLNTSYRVEITEKKEKFEKQLPLEIDDLYNKIENLTEQQKVEQIIKYFLKNNKITCFSEIQRISDYQYLFNVVKGYNSSLAFRLFCDKKILHDCFNKYALDRNTFLSEKEDIRCYEIFTTEHTSSYEEESYFGQKYIQLSLIKKEEKLYCQDERFLKSWVLEKLTEQGQYANYIIDNEVNIAELICGDLIILLPDKLVYQKTKAIVDNYNRELNNQKRLQLKMEGF